MICCRQCSVRGAVRPDWCPPFPQVTLISTETVQITPVIPAVCRPVWRGGGWRRGTWSRAPRAGWTRSPPRSCPPWCPARRGICHSLQYSIIILLQCRRTWTSPPVAPAPPVTTGTWWTSCSLRTTSTSSTPVTCCLQLNFFQLNKK